MTSNITIILDRMAEALSRQGVRMKRARLLQAVAEAFGHRNEHELAAAAADGFSPPAARHILTTGVAGIGEVVFFADPEGNVFGLDRSRIDALEGRASNWIVSPLGGLVDISALRGIGRPSPAQTAGPVTNLCREVILPPLDPEQPAYMTSGCCEVASVTQEDLDALGLPHGEFEGSFYPLTDEETGYIAEDVVDAKDGLHGALIAYAVLYRGAKHLMPSIEIAYQTDRDGEGEFPARDQVLPDARAYADRILPKVRTMGGNVLIDMDHDDRVIVQILVPIAAAMAVGDFDAWKRHLAWLMIDPDLPSVVREPIRHTGGEFAAEVSWIGEGEDGDYDPANPADEPLLRFDAYRLVDGRWEEQPDGSYCTQVPAWCTAAQARALARYVVDALEHGDTTGIKRLLESASWTDLRAVEAARQEQTAMDALYGPDAYVAHETYGNPDRGTSVDLRRRADGSIRCEVYVDLASAAVLEARDMDEVRAWLKTLPSDIENADGPNQPSHALAPVWEDDEDPEGGVRWMLVPADESEEDWFAETPSAAPFGHRFVTVDKMDV